MAIASSLPGASEDKWHSLSFHTAQAVSQQPCLSPEALLCAHRVTSTRYASSNNPNPGNTKCPVTQFLSEEESFGPFQGLRTLRSCERRVAGCPLASCLGGEMMSVRGLLPARNCFHKELRADATMHKRG